MADDEVVLFNKNAVKLNFDDLSVEELEQRLEMAIGMLPEMGLSGTCDQFSCASKFLCDNFLCHGVFD
jgi:hypothetical protein